MSDTQTFARWLVLTTAVFVFLQVSGVLFGPWEIDSNAVVLISLVSQPGAVALGWLLPRSSSS